MTKQFSRIEKLNTGILYVLELTASLSVLLLAFGLIASMATVLTNGSVLTNTLLMQHIWAWTLGHCSGGIESKGEKAAS